MAAGGSGVLAWPCRLCSRSGLHNCSCLMHEGGVLRCLRTPAWSRASYTATIRIDKHHITVIQSRYGSPSLRRYLACSMVSTHESGLYICHAYIRVHTIQLHHARMHPQGFARRHRSEHGEAEALEEPRCMQKAEESRDVCWSRSATPDKE